MTLEGRIEKRVTKVVTLYISNLKKPGAREKVFTENISLHGARVITIRRWELGEEHRVTSLTGEFQLPARVVYCQPCSNRGYRVGLHFGARSVNWQNALTIAPTRDLLASQT